MIRNLDLLKGEQNCWPKRDYSKINLGIARFEPLSNRGPPPAKENIENNQGPEGYQIQSDSE